MTTTVDLLQFVSSPPSKRRKLNQKNDLRSFRPGSIIRIKLQNFMSYSLSEFQMSPNLNMIIGPNGTGKSTIVCAICVGLAGKLDYLGKHSMNISQFVKQGEQSAVVEIELKSAQEGESVVLTREIDAVSSKSTWRKNSYPVTEKAVKELVLSLDIQLDNLCQFLAQDRVSKFAAQKPTELLKEIEKSFKDGHLLKQHERLIQLSSGLKEFQAEKNDIDSSLATLIREKDSLSAEVEKFKKYQEKKQDLSMHHKLLPFVKIQDAKAKFNEKKKHRDKKVRELRLFKEKTKPISSIIGQFSKDSSNLGHQLDDLEPEAEALKTLIKRKTAQSQEFDEDIDKLRTDLRRKLTEIVKKSHKLEAAKEELSKWDERKSELECQIVPDSELESLTNLRGLKAQELNEERRKTDSQVLRLQRMKNNERKLDSTIHRLKLELNSDDKITILRNHDEFSVYYKTYQALQFLRQHKNQFQGILYESAVVSLTVEDGYGLILGNIASLDSQLAIITTSEEHHKRVTRKIMDDLKINISFRQVSSNFSINEKDRYSRNQLRQLGFSGYLTDYIKGPEPVIQMLCEQHMIHLIPVSLKPLTPDQLDRIQKQTNIQTFVSGDQILRTFKSQYGDKQTYSTATFLNPNYKLFGRLGLSQDLKLSMESEIKLKLEEQRKLSEELKLELDAREELQQRIQDLKKLYDESNVQVKALHEKRRLFVKLNTKVEMLTEEIKILNQEIDAISNINHSELTRKTNERIRDLLKQKLDTFAEISTLYEQLQKINQSIVLTSFMQLEQQNRKLSMETLVKDVEDEKRRLELECEDLKEECKLMKKETLLKIKRLNDEVNSSLSEEEKEVLAVLAKKYMDLGQFEEDKILIKIEEIRKDLEQFNDAEESSITKYNRVESRISELETRLPQLEESIKAMDGQISEIESKWLPELNELISQISDNFHSDFSKIYPLGQVRLYQDPESYSEWRLEIMVQFRQAESMSVLDSTTQSGGEKSVSTAIFLNSLQGLVNAPFRVVDEINQGMDLRNERLVHKLITESACSEEKNASQYFLITPKLLTNLAYNEKMSVHCIMAGKYCPDPLVDLNFLKFGIGSRYV